MRFITFKTLEGRNFLSFGDDLVHVDLRPGVNAIVGSNHDKEDSKNGAGKCLDRSTEIEISIDSAMVAEKFNKFLQKR